MTVDNRVSGYTDEEMNAMFEEFVALPARPEKMGGAIRKRMQSEDYSEWLVPGILSSELTQIYGQREAGKSSFVREVIAPLTQGKPVFGVTPTTGDRPLNILVLGTDPGAEEEYISKLQGIGYEEGRVGVEYVGNGEIPAYAYTKAKYGAIDLVVIDNLAGLAPGKELNDSATAGYVFLKYEEFISAGVPVVLVAHEGKGGGGTTTGSHQHEAKPRFRANVRFDRQSRTLTVNGAGNLGQSKIRFRADEEFRLTLLDTDIPQAEEVKRSRAPEILDTAAEVWELARESRASSQRAVAREIAPKVGLGESTVRRHLDTGVRSGKLTLRQGQIPLYE